MRFSVIAQADAIKIPLSDRSVHCCVTSPPYWGLRKYAGDQGDEPLGLESTPERHVQRIVEICREVRRVLRDDGVFWLNYGDCYASGHSECAYLPPDSPKRPKTRKPGAKGGMKPRNHQGTAPTKSHSGVDQYKDKTGFNAQPAGIRPGSLMMMPHRVALALQADGWIVRRDLIWWKRNPMPESPTGTRWVKHRIKVGGGTKHSGGVRGNASGDFHVSLHEREDVEWTDCSGCEKCIPNDGLVLKRGSWRHTTAHEFIFMLTKKMGYWSNQEAVREGVTGNAHPKGHGVHPKSAEEGIGIRANDSFSAAVKEIVSTRNPRSVLDVPTAPYKGAHYATFPPNLIAPLIRATCPRWACPVCGQGWAAVVNTSYGKSPAHGDGSQIGKDGTPHGMTGMPRVQRRDNTLGYKPTCSHEHTQEEAVPGIVFDPFLGSGTTVAVAKDLLRRGIGIDISMEYLDQQAKIRAGLGTPSNALDDLPLFQ